MITCICSQVNNGCLRVAVRYIMNPRGPANVSDQVNGDLPHLGPSVFMLTTEERLAAAPRQSLAANLTFSSGELADAGQFNTLLFWL